MKKTFYMILAIIRYRNDFSENENTLHDLVESLKQNVDFTQEEIIDLKQEAIRYEKMFIETRTKILDMFFNLIFKLAAGWGLVFLVDQFTSRHMILEYCVIGYGLLTWIFNYIQVILLDEKIGIARDCIHKANELLNIRLCMLGIIRRVVQNEKGVTRYYDSVARMDIVKLYGVPFGLCVLLTISILQGLNIL